MARMLSFGMSAALMFVGQFVTANDLPPPPRAGSGTSATKTLSPEERAELMALKIRAGAKIKVNSYDKKNRTFDIMIVTETAVGPNTTNFENLKRAMNQPTAARRLGNPQDWVGREMTLVQDLILLPDAEAPAPAATKKPASSRAHHR